MPNDAAGFTAREHARRAFIGKQLGGQFNLGGNRSCTHERRGRPFLSSDLQFARPQCPHSRVTQNKNQQISTVRLNTTSVEFHECRGAPATRCVTAASHSASAGIHGFPRDRWNHHNALGAVQDCIGDRILRFLGNFVQHTGCSAYT